MAKSFYEAMQEAQNAASLSSTPATMSMEHDDTEPVTEIALYASETFKRSPKYLWYENYSDDRLSYVDDLKNVTIDESQINLTQEKNSQFIPFEMNRYYDGIDLMEMNLQVYFVNKDGQNGLSVPINVTYSSTKIRFGWLVDEYATAIAGDVYFEIRAVGVNERGDEYIWKTKPNGKINILKSLEGNGIIEPSMDWTSSFITQINEKVADAQSAMQSAQSAASNAEDSAQEAQKALEDAKIEINNAKEELKETVSASVVEEVDKKVAIAMADYYNKAEVDAFIASLDISEQYEAFESQMNESFAGLEEQVNVSVEKMIQQFSDFEYEVTLTIQDYASEVDEVKEMVANLDGLANFNVEYDGKLMTFYNGEDVIKEIAINSDPSVEWTTSYTAIVDDKISTAKTEVLNELDSYKTEIDEDLKSIHGEIDGLPETLETDYYNKNAVDELLAAKADKSDIVAANTAIEAVQSTANLNKDNISLVSTKLVELETVVDTIDKSPRLTYDATYDESFTYTIWEIVGEGSEEEVRTAKSQFVIQGGGGSSTSSVLKIEYVTKSPYIGTINDKFEIKYNFSGVDSSGDIVSEGVATWKIGNVVIATNIAVDGENTFDVTEYINLGTQKIVLSITDDAGSLVTKSWTVQKVDVRMESGFNDKLTYPLGPIAFDYTPYGAISKDIHFILDGNELETVTTSASGIPMGYTLPPQAHGSHLLDVYMTATVNNNTITSNHIVKDIIWFDETSSIPVIGCTQTDITALQYDTTNIIYTVYDPTTESPQVTLSVDGEVVSTLTLEKNTETWQFKSADVGDHILTITCGETVKTINVTVEELDIEIEPVTAGLMVDFNPIGKSNSDTDRIWSNDNYKMTVSDNFDWVNGGYQIDGNGDQYFCIKAGTNVEFDYLMFADDAKRNGKEMKLIFKTANVQQANAQFLSCVDNTTGSDHIGIEMFAHEAYVYGSSDKLHLKYSENDIIEFEFNITKNTESISEICGYEDGCSTRHLVYDDTFNFTQNTPKPLRIGSDKCDLHIYRLKIYNTSLTARGVLNNFIADARNAGEMIDRYTRNQIYNENNELTPESLAEACPWLRVYIVSAPYFTNKKSDKVPYTTIRQIYKDGDPILDNWIAYNVQHSGQGTSSDNYGSAARNMDFIMNKSGIDGVKPYFILGDGKTEATKVSLTRTSIPNAYFNFKANVASSNHFTNPLLAKRYNEFNPYKLPYVREDESIIDYIKTTMEFHNAVVFIQETDEDLSTHREFADTDVHFYSIGNIGDSKKSDDTRLVDPTDRYECINEICDVELPLSDWPNTPEAIEALEAELFDKSGSYEWRYIWEDGTDEENAEVREYCKQRWIEMYKFVVQSSDEEFKANFDKYFVKDSMLFYYLFTTRYCMVDNRAKNLFPHYGKTGEVDSEGNPIRKWDLVMGYDFDSSMSLNNYGNSVYRHGYEDTDTLDGTDEEVFRESDSTLFCRIRDNFADELKEMYNTLESKNAWHAESFLNEIETWQSQFPEELWRLDCQKKYLDSYLESFIGQAGDPQFLKNMAQGKMKYPVKQWERAQEAYMASKYQSSLSASDNINLRCTVPSGNLVVPAYYGLKITPYDYVYLNVKYGNTLVPIQVRAVPGVQYEIPYDGTVDILDIYSASCIQDLGDLSSTYPTTVDTSKATRLKELHIGNKTAGYDNPYLTTMTLGANYLLEVLNIENVSGLTQSLNLTALNNLRELYAHGTNTGGVTFASGGAIQTAELPAITALSAKNLAYLTNLDIASYDKLTTLTIENCSTIDIINIFEIASNINRVRIAGIDWTLTDTNLLDRIYGMTGIDKNGYNISQSVLAGKVHVPIMRQQLLADYNAAWPDLEITYDTLIEQFSVTFKNDDGTILDVQYVDKGEKAVDPIYREVNPIPTPTKESTVSTDFTYKGWDSEFITVFTNQTYTATYSESTRIYTVRYISKGVVKQTSTGEYGSKIDYTGDIPTYTAEESAYKYHLFSRWDKSGYVDGDKDINAIFDTFEYTNNFFIENDISTLRPVEIYAMIQLGLEQESVSEKDYVNITLGHDYNYDDVESKVLISEKTTFNGSNYIDTGIKLFEEDRDFVLAVDFVMPSTGNETNSVLMQCYQANGSNGFKIWYNSGVKFTWGTNSSSLTTNREMIVLRHIKGDNNLYIYNSNISGNSISLTTVTRTKNTIGDGTLVFGCARADDGVYENYGCGTIHWAKVWYTDLGDAECRDLAVWTHESIKMEMCGFRRHYLTDNPSKKCAMTFLAANLLDRTKTLHTVRETAGGWPAMSLNKFLNERLYEAFPYQWKALIKKVNVASSAGGGSKEIVECGCNIYIPSYRALYNITSEPYIYEETDTISYLTTNASRVRRDSTGTAKRYWTRSPRVDYTYYAYTCETDGTMYSYSYPYNAYGILIQFSI